MQQWQRVIYRKQYPFIRITHSQKMIWGSRTLSWRNTILLKYILSGQSSLAQATASQKATWPIYISPQRNTSNQLSMIKNCYVFILIAGAHILTSGFASLT